MTQTHLSYERYMNEIQFLRKQISAQKQAHENTLKQLQSAYQIIDDMKEMLRMEQTTNLKLKSEVADKGNRLTAITGQYEEQISSIKQMIMVKDEELRRLSSVLLVSNADMIRLKIVNEVELVHSEQVERLNLQIDKKNSEIGEIKNRLEVIKTKYEYLSEEGKRKQEEMGQKFEENNRRHANEVKGLFEATERGKNECEKLKRRCEKLEERVRKQNK